MTQHTPGPWVATGFEGIVVNASDGLTLALAPGQPGNLPQMKANAALIAAAPDMLAALEAIMGESSRDDDDHDVIATIQGICRAIIAKAKGGAA